MKSATLIDDARTAPQRERKKTSKEKEKKKERKVGERRWRRRQPPPRGPPAPPHLLHPRAVQLVAFLRLRSFSFHFPPPQSPLIRPPVERFTGFFLPGFFYWFSGSCCCLDFKRVSSWLYRVFKRSFRYFDRPCRVLLGFTEFSFYWVFLIGFLLLVLWFLLFFFNFKRVSSWFYRVFKRSFQYFNRPSRVSLGFTEFS